VNGDNVTEPDQWKPRRIDGLDICEVVDGYVVYETGNDRVHYLNSTAALVLELCTGDNSRHDIAALLRQAFNLPASPDADVTTVLGNFSREGLVR
jgi:hypothetical protein